LALAFSKTGLEVHPVVGLSIDDNQGEQGRMLVGLPVILNGRPVTSQRRETDCLAQYRQGQPGPRLGAARRCDPSAQHLTVAGIAASQRRS
jgi:hypothetical protein